MTEQELRDYCFYYKGEALPPYQQRDYKRLLWLAEKWVCEEGCNRVDSQSPKSSVASLVAAYVSKWEPFNTDKVLKIYLRNVPELSEKIRGIYS